MAALVALILLLANTAQAAEPTCLMKYKRVDRHSACLQPSRQATNIGVSDADKLFIVQRHNEDRDKVQPPAHNMLKMYWDEEVAQIAQGWAQNCEYKHDLNGQRSIPGRFAVGQNIAKGYSDWTRTIDAWYNEYKHFTYGSGSTDGSAVGHYTQMVWAYSSALGCGFAMCSGHPQYVCNYGPAGNVGAGSSTPYLKGSAISSACPRYRDGNLCDCGSNTCANGGTMNLETCKCTCVATTIKFIKGDLCSLNCKLADENVLSRCGTSFPKTYCAKYLNVPYECPMMCEVCPYGDEVYDKNAAIGACSTGSALPGVYCGRGPGGTNCSGTYQCMVDQLDRWAVCCPKVDSVTNRSDKSRPTTVTFPDSTAGSTPTNFTTKGSVGIKVLCWPLLLETMALLTTIYYYMARADIV